MRVEDLSEERLVRYLLGKLPEAEEVQVEDRALADAEYRGSVEAAEADLIDTYVRGELPQADRRAFELRFLNSPSRRRKVAFAKALATVTAETAEIEIPRPSQSLLNWFRTWNPALRYATGFAALICVAGSTWLFFDNAAVRSRLAAVENQRRELQVQEQGLRRQLQEEQARAAAAQTQPQQPVVPLPSVASLVLLPGLSRAETRVEQLVLPSTAQVARIEIQLEPRDIYPRFRAELRTRNGDEVLIRGNLPPQRTSTGGSVSFDVPTSALVPGEYELSLTAPTDPQNPVIGYYYFRVRMQSR
jgi:hypothetical protein